MQFLRLTYLKKEIFMNQDFGTVKGNPDNATHIGKTQFLFFRNITSYEIKSLAMAKNRVVLNTTSRPCNNNRWKQLNLMFFKKTLASTKAKNETVQVFDCPLLEVFLSSTFSKVLINLVSGQLHNGSNRKIHSIAHNGSVVLRIRGNLRPECFLHHFVQRTHYDVSFISDQI